jgi:hypothetical protein
MLEKDYATSLLFAEEHGYTHEEVVFYFKKLEIEKVRHDILQTENRLIQKIYWSSLIQILTVIGSIVMLYKLLKP